MTHAIKRYSLIKKNDCGKQYMRCTECKVLLWGMGGGGVAKSSTLCKTLKMLKTLDTPLHVVPISTVYSLIEWFNNVWICTMVQV